MLRPSVDECSQEHSEDGEERIRRQGDGLFPGKARIVNDAMMTNASRGAVGREDGGDHSGQGEGGEWAG